MTAPTTIRTLSGTSPEVGRPARRRRKRPGEVVVIVGMACYALIAVGPLLLMLVGSFRTSQALFTEPIGIEWPLTFDAYRTAWTQANFSGYFINSILVTVGSVLISTAVSVLAAYALSRSRGRVAGTVESLFLSGLMLPIHLAILPVFYLLDRLSLVNNLFGLTLVYAAAGVPFSIFVLTSFFRQLPEELEEAAQIDGAGPLQRFWFIMVPLVRPAITTVAVFRFVPVWNDFLYPLVLLRSPDRYTLPVGLTTFFGQYQTNWSALFAGLVIATVPLVLLFLVATKQIISGLTAGMSK